MRDDMIDHRRRGDFPALHALVAQRISLQKRRAGFAPAGIVATGFRTAPAGNIKPEKEKSTEKIDGVVALVMALDRAQRNLNGGSVYDERGLLTLDW